MKYYIKYEAKDQEEKEVKQGILVFAQHIDEAIYKISEYMNFHKLKGVITSIKKMKGGKDGNKY